MSLQVLTYPLFSVWHTLKTSRPIQFISEWIRYLTNVALPKKKEEGIFIESVIFRPISQLRPTHEHHFRCDSHFPPSWKNVKEILISEDISECKVGDAIDVYYDVIIKTPTGDYSTQSYIAPYTYPCPISFPPYSFEELKEYRGKNPTVVFACSTQSLDEKNKFTDICQRYAGPKHNFYSDLPPRRGLLVWRELIIPPREDIQLQVINSHGENFSFKPGDMLDWLHPIKPQLEPSEVRKETFAFSESDGPSI